MKKKYVLMTFAIIVLAMSSVFVYAGDGVSPNPRDEEIAAYNKCIDRVAHDFNVDIGISIVVGAIVGIGTFGGGGVVVGMSMGGGAAMIAQQGISNCKEKYNMI